jgi:lipopolysaccharide/colanic/teichoic acid biosynthesis glycosyltransferase
VSTHPKITENRERSGPRPRSGCLRGAYNLEPRAEDVLDETLFHSALTLERKRAERSGQSFALMLLDGTQFPGAAGDSKRIPLFLVTLTRDTDVVGWYGGGSVLGLIFTEIDPKNVEDVLQILRTRIESGLEEKLGTEKSKQTILSIDVFPENVEGNSSDGTGNFASAKFYPEGAKQNSGRRISLVVKRAIDIIGSGLLLILLAPLFAAIALAIKLTSEGEVLFKQERLGHYGIPFQFLKFRSMYVNNSSHIHQEFIKGFIQRKSDDEEQVPARRVYKIALDPRVTPVGRFLRKSSLDELPQLWNVFVGEMSLVGPRPPLQYEFRLYDIWHRRRVLEAKPGITGLWQVNGRSRTCFDDMVRLDLRYARSWSLWLDLFILLRTPFAVFSGDGAY